MSTLLIDCETFSELDVTEVGSTVYAQHPTTRVLLWAVRDPAWPRTLVFEEPNLWALLTQLKKANQIGWTRNEPLDLIHWSAFDRHIAMWATPSIASADDEWDGDAEPGAYKGPNNTYWGDLAQVSLLYGGPAMLKWASQFWGGEGNVETKDSGKHLITKFCAPQKKGKHQGRVYTQEDDEVRWEQFRQYAGQDASSMVPIFNRFRYLAENGGEDVEKHWPFLRAIARMNERGAPVDVRSARIANKMLEQEAYRIKQETKKIYGFFPTSAKKVAEYLGLPNCQQATIESFLSTKPAAKKRKLAQARSLTAGAASKKLVPIIRRTVNSARLHDCFRYWGAWTGRLTSLGVQLQNLVREPSDEEWFEKLNKPKSKFANVFKGVRNNIRGFIQAAVGYVLISGDYNAIECRVSAWLAGEEWLLKAFRDGEDPYLIMASEIFGETITDKEDPRRQLGKIVELGSQYQLGWEALQARCLQDDIRLSKRQAQEIVIAYRTLHANIVKCWALSEKTFIDAMHLLPGEHITLTNGIRFERIEHAVKVVRRSGFAQYYWNPRMEMGHWKNCDYSHCNGCKEDICYTGRRKTGAMGKKTTYGGDIFQGYVQGTALDYMLEGMTNVEEAGYPPVMSVHDDITCEIEDDGEDYTEDYNDRLCRSPKWAKGLPIKAECWQQRRYTK